MCRISRPKLPEDLANKGVVRIYETLEAMDDESIIHNMTQAKNWRWTVSNATDLPGWIDMMSFRWWLGVVQAQGRFTLDELPLGRL